MNIEIIEFFPRERFDEKQILTGSLAIFLPDLGLDIRGVFCSRKRDFWFFSMPSGRGVSRETGEDVRYPFIALRDREKNKELLLAIREISIPFVERFLKEHPQALIDNQPASCRWTESESASRGQVESESERVLVKARSTPREPQQTKTKAARSTPSHTIKTAPELKRTMQLGKIAVKEYRDLAPRTAKTSK